ncbi:Divergent PAP2 family protein [Candidatus Izimaplasma bacterium HR1]|jgi:acid phosphatase family membrane protein YuiD|uniref:divergent PAP2 family protein n=1 Tax=Candidatus Izimoplasma sp. HR1 TaxID=1541959 RepID=UPI0004F82F2E|nr:Divergent PAP2 family protein [Candidatus Izimaplasma bacterium HR1]
MLFNFPLEIALISMIIAQLVKLPIQRIIDKKWTPSIIFSTGGMPSSHSAFVTALTLAFALTEGVTSPFFAISFVFASVIIHDAVGIRREAGKHATVLNQMKEEFDLLVKEVSKGRKRDDKVVESKLKELLGHEPIEALTGTLLGALLTLIYYFTIIV